MIEDVEAPTSSPVCYIFFGLFIGSMGRESVVGIATHYGLDGPGIESR
jgi:hypothetical protein